MKHGRRHVKLKEQVYLAKARAHAYGYGRAYDPIPVRASSGHPTGPPPPALLLEHVLDARALRSLRYRVG